MQGTKGTSVLTLILLCSVDQVLILGSNFVLAASIDVCSSSAAEARFRNSFTASFCDALTSASVLALGSSSAALAWGVLNSGADFLLDGTQRSSTSSQDLSVV